MASFVQLKPGASFKGRYALLRCIQAGGMGAIYEVRDTVTRRRRALKTMLPNVVEDPDLRARFAEEATVTADIESTHIVEVFDAGVDDETGLPFIVMELLDGKDLGATLEQQGPLAPEDVVVLLQQAALALNRTHAANIVHRDLKPENLFVTRRDDGSPHVKVLDFGIAKVIKGTAKTTRNIGTPLYMSPEQIRGDAAIGTRADLYAMGHIAFSLLVGEAYWEPESRECSSVFGLFMQVVEGLPEPATIRAQRRGVTLPEAFDAWFDRATAAVPADRFATASELVGALAEALDVPLSRTSSLPGAALERNTPLPPLPTRPAPKTLGIAAVAGVGLLAGLALLWWPASRHDESDEAPSVHAPRLSAASAHTSVAEGTTVRPRESAGGFPEPSGIVEEQRPAASSRSAPQQPRFAGSPSPPVAPTPTHPSGTVAAPAASPSASPPRDPTDLR